MNDGFQDLPQKLADARAEIRDEYLGATPGPWVVGFSGGKDSTLVLHLVMEVLIAIPPSRRTRSVHVLANDTLVESPLIAKFLDKTLAQIRSGAEATSLPIQVAKTSPDLDQTFWVNVIGRGYPAPYRMFRWCTDRMKIRPTTNYMRTLLGSDGTCVLLLGVRRSESAARAKTVSRYDNGTRLNPHNDVRGCLVYRPIVEFDTKEVWATLLQARPPWGGSYRELVTLYRNAGGGECPFVTELSDTPSCGTSSARFGCWTCTVVEKDKSMRGMIDSGNEELEPLAEFRDWLAEFTFRDDKRMGVRRNGQVGKGPLTMAAREEILRRLEDIQEQTGFPLISRLEKRRIQEIWLDDLSMAARREVDWYFDALTAKGAGNGNG